MKSKLLTIPGMSYNQATAIHGFIGDINRFTKYYIDTIKQKGINDNFSDVSITGIKIKELEVYAKGSDIVNMIYLKPKIKYKNFLNENYNYLNF